MYHANMNPPNKQAPTYPFKNWIFDVLAGSTEGKSKAVYGY
jgi:hypothetical protein